MRRHPFPLCLHVFFSDFLFVCLQCLPKGRLLVRVHVGTFDIRSKRFWHRTGFISQSATLLPSPNMAELPRYRGMRWSICLLSLYTERLKWSFPYWWQVITHTLTSCILGNTEGALTLVHALCLSLSLSLSMPSSLCCCLVDWTICDDARTRTLHFL